ncbi:hypothetical protein ACQPYH_07195 [Kribbella sp. CA-245084]|uniref:hypothetical protein n=1 Tax=Kribbella sp. CA-245084 TaxID=3239940 RepID=UPI003D8A8A0B
MADWWSAEVLDGADSSASKWWHIYGEVLTAAAIGHGIEEWNLIDLEHLVVFEVGFRAATDWSAFRRLGGVESALDAVPDPVNGLIVYRGRGGTSGSSQMRRSGPHGGGDSMALPLPPDDVRLDLTKGRRDQSGRRLEAPGEDETPPGGS